MVDAIYGAFQYNQAKYGQQPKLAINAQPFVALATDYSTIRLSWSDPVNTGSSPFVKIRLVRNFDQFPENAEDGEILLEAKGTDPILPKNSLGLPQFNDTGVIAGQFVYYRIWLLMSSSYVEAPLEWLSAGDTYTLVPNPHDAKSPANAYESINSSGVILSQKADEKVLLTTHDKFMSMLPEVFRLDSTHNNNENLFNFLKPFSFTLDEMLTYADITRPDFSGRKTNPSVLNLQSFQLSLPIDSNGVTRAQKKLVRDAIWTYSRKGTAAGLERFVENVTGCESKISILPNLLLSMQDASFYQGIGNWTASNSSTTFTAEQVGSASLPTVGTDDKVYDTEWLGKVVVTTATPRISLGVDDPTTKGIPVVGGTNYTLSFYAKAAQTSTITPEVFFYDVQGNLVGTNSGTALNTSTNFGSAYTLNVLAPSSAVKAGLSFLLTTTSVYNTFRFDRIQFSEVQDSPYYSEPRTVDIFINPNKTNFCWNPSVETNTTGWSASGVTISRVAASGTDILAPQDVPSGGFLLKSVFSGSGSITIPTQNFIPNGYVTASIYHSTKTGEKDFTLNLRAHCNNALINSMVQNNVGTVWFSEPHVFQVGDGIYFSGTTGLDAVSSTVTEVGNNYVKFATSGISNYVQQVETGNAIVILEVSSATITSKTSWERSQVTLYVPPTFPNTPTRQTWVTAKIVSSSGTGTVYFEAAQVENSIRATDYFDGSLIAQGATWGDSTLPHNSRSYFYVNRIHHLARLVTSVKGYLPKNSTYRIYDYKSQGTAEDVVRLS